MNLLILFKIHKKHQSSVSNPIKLIQNKFKDYSDLIVNLNGKVYKNGNYIES